MYASKSSNGYLLSTQCEALGFRRIIYSLDRPDILSIYTVRMEADKTAYPILLSNGNRVDGGDIPETGTLSYIDCKSVSIVTYEHYSSSQDDIGHYGMILSQSQATCLPS